MYPSVLVPLHHHFGRFHQIITVKLNKLSVYFLELSYREILLRTS